MSLNNKAVVTVNNYDRNIEDNDDLEKTLVRAAQDADSRSHEQKLINQEEYEIFCENSNSNITKDESIKLINTEGKRKRNYELEEIEISNKKIVARPLESYSKVVAAHYNLLEEKGLQERSKSRIVYMRNFHNWIKSTLINEYLTKIKDNKKHREPVRVHDMCCGKGGDLLKWKKGYITHLVCSDIASISLEQCKSRYDDMKNRERNTNNLYSIEYISGDCSTVRLRERYKDPSMKLDLVSCQFAFHYSFESLSQANCMIRNASECLQPGGFFIGTIPDSNDLIARARKANSIKFGNDVFTVQFDFDFTKPPLFGAKYNFQLDGVVNCPEFLVHFPTFVKLARKYGLKLIGKEKFYDYYERMHFNGRQLLCNMKSLETYPPNESVSLVGSNVDDYTHAKEFLYKQDNKEIKLGTLSKSEWEASSLYMIFVFQKVKNIWNADGTPCYDFS